MPVFDGALRAPVPCPATWLFFREDLAVAKIIRLLIMANISHNQTVCLIKAWVYAGTCCGFVAYAMFLALLFLVFFIRWFQAYFNPSLIVLPLLRSLLRACGLVVTWVRDVTMRGSAGARWRWRCFCTWIHCGSWLFGLPRNEHDFCIDAWSYCWYTSWCGWNIGMICRY